MEKLSSDPELQALLEQKGIKIIPNIPSWTGWDKEKGMMFTLQTGDITGTGTVMGFCIEDKAFMAVIFDETKEGEDSLTLLKLSQ